jgi:hypothetical protein
MVVVELWCGETLINTWEKPVLLAPTKNVPKESVEKKLNLEVSKFVREEGIPGVMQTPVPEGFDGTPKEPGFEVMGGIVAILSVIVLKRRSKW